MCSWETIFALVTSGEVMALCFEPLARRRALRLPPRPRYGRAGSASPQAVSAHAWPRPTSPQRSSFGGALQHHRSRCLRAPARADSVYANWLICAFSAIAPPLNGVFAVVVEGLERPYGGVCNIGVRPTVEGREPLLEAHLFDFDGSLYGQLLTVRFLEKIRDEQRFDGLEALQRANPPGRCGGPGSLGSGVCLLSLGGRPWGLRTAPDPRSGTKALIRESLALGARIDLTSFFALVHAENRGAAFSFLAGASGWQRWFPSVGWGFSPYGCSGSFEPWAPNNGPWP